MVVAVVVVGIVVTGALALLAFVISRGTSPGSSELRMVGAKLDGLPEAVMATREHLVSLSERVGAIESSAEAMREGLHRLDSSLAQTGTVATGIRETTETIRQEMARAQEGLGKLQASARSREEIEALTARSIRRLEAVIAGTSSKGMAGENLCELVFAQLPPEWQERDFRIGNRSVEFALRLPNALVVPIDSKWPATGLLEQFVAAEDPSEQQRLKSQIEQAVVAKAREVRKYLDPGLTTDYGVAVVPDAVYELCGGVLAEAMQLDVMLISQSMFVPCLMMLFQSAVRDSRDVDVEKLAGYLRAADQGLAALSREIEGRLSNAMVMLGNSRDHLRAETARVASGLAAVTLPALEGWASTQGPEC